MRNFSKLVDEVIKLSDILLIVIDARRIAESVNKDLEKKVLCLNKKFIYVINKSDLIKELEYVRLPNALYVSAAKHLGTMKLLKKIMQVAHGQEVLVGVIGYPNTGKSTLINSLKGKHSVLTSPVSGFTKAIQKVRINSKIMMIDTPGVIPYSEKKNPALKETDFLLIGAKDFSKVRDPEHAACELIKILSGKIEKYFSVSIHEDPLETLEEIALKRNMISKGKVADTNRAGQEVIKLWQKGKIR